jgi:hypothetical protein
LDVGQVDSAVTRDAPFEVLFVDGPNDDLLGFLVDGYLEVVGRVRQVANPELELGEGVLAREDRLH